MREACESNLGILLVGVNSIVYTAGWSTMIEVVLKLGLFISPGVTVNLKSVEMYLSAK